VKVFINHLYTQLGTTLYRWLTLTYSWLQYITVSTSRFLATDLTHWRFFSFRGHAVARWLALHTWTHSATFSESLAQHNSRLTTHLELRKLIIQVKVSHIVTEGQSISKSWCWAPSGAHDHIFITVWQLRSCLCGAPSLTRWRVCLLFMLLALVSVVVLGSESLGTRDHILLSQIWDFPFRRPLRLTVEVFEPASTRMIDYSQLNSHL
jgi:hypothetical protein